MPTNCRRQQVHSETQRFRLRTSPPRALMLRSESLLGHHPSPPPHRPGRRLCQSQCWRLRQVHASAHPDRGPGAKTLFRACWKYSLTDGDMCWRTLPHFLPKKQGGWKRAQWKALNIQWHEGHQDRKTQDFSLSFSFFLLLNDQSSSKKQTADGVFMPGFGV